MAIDLKTYTELEEKYGKFASWGLWDSKDITKPPTVSDLNRMRTDIIFVGLNATEATVRDWEAFHFASGKGRRHYDDVFRDIVYASKVEGAYITDLFKGPVNNVFDPKAGKVLKYMKAPENISEFTTKCEQFFEELDRLDGLKTVFVFGGSAYELIARYYKSKGLAFDPKKVVNAINGKKFVKLIHYSNQYYRKNGPLQYRNQDEMKKYDVDLIKRHG